MSSSVCHGLQSCLESSHVQPHVLMHRLAPQKPNLYKNQEAEENSHEEVNSNLETWSFIQALTNTSHYNKQRTKTEEVYAYVHPFVKRSSSTLSTMSLEMCTESLGSETGSEISESSDEFASKVMEKQSNHGLKQPKSRDFTKKVSRPVNFPPPLTSISGSDGVQFKPHRKDGRLVLKAVTVSSCNTCFRAERSDGRLRLSFLKGSNVNFDNELDESQKNVCDEDSEVVIRHEHDDKVEDDYCGEDGDDDVDDGGEDDANGDFWEDDMKGNGEKVGCEIEVGDFPRPSRCKEGGNGNQGMPNWGTFCMAIS